MNRVRRTESGGAEPSSRTVSPEKSPDSIRLSVTETLLNHSKRWPISILKIGHSPARARPYAPFFEDSSVRIESPC